MKRRAATFLVIVTLLFLTLIVISIYGAPVLNRLPRTVGDGLALLLTPLSIVLLFSPLFASTTWFFGLLAAALLLALLALVRVRPSWPIRLSLAAGILLLAAAPFALPIVYGAYTLAFEAEEGYTMFWLTQPERPFASAFKSAQRVHERGGCSYHLLGWSEADVLYYSAACDGRVWAFDPTVDHAPRAVTQAPAVLIEAAIERALPVGRARSYPAHPLGFPPEAKNHVITYEKALSPTGQWAAAAIKNYYGPRDVVVVSRRPTILGAEAALVDEAQ